VKWLLAGPVDADPSLRRTVGRLEIDDDPVFPAVHTAMLPQGSAFRIVTPPRTFGEITCGFAPR
jgi:hypothetical protein